MKAQILSESEFIKTGRMVLAANATAGDMQVINGLAVVVMEAGLAGDTVLVCYQADCVRATKAAALAVGGGDVVYLAANGSEINATALNNTRAGIALQAQLAADTTVDFALFPATL